MKKLLATMALAALPFAASAEGSFMNTHTLLTNLNDHQAIFLSYGYIAGVADSDDGNLFCLPPMSAANLADVIRREHMDRAGRTDHYAQSARFFVRVALNKAFPCPDSMRYKK